MEKKVFGIFKTLVKQNPTISLIPAEDVLQEIRISLYIKTDFFEALKLAGKQVCKLVAEYGFSRKKGKDNFVEISELTEEQKDLLNKIEDLYINNNLTSKEVCNTLKVEWNTTTATLLAKVFPKNMGKGGARKGCGNKKGWNKK